jgi:hypothetical protein
MLDVMRTLSVAQFKALALIPLREPITITAHGIPLGMYLPAGHPATDGFAEERPGHAVYVDQATSRAVRVVDPVRGPTYAELQAPKWFRPVPKLAVAAEAQAPIDEPDPPPASTGEVAP